MNLNGWLGSWAGKRIALIALVATTVAACEGMSAESGQRSGGGGGDTSGPILVGHFASMTGSEATFGQSTDNGVRLAIDERNARGGVHGRKFELITLDDAGKTQEAGTAVTRLITERPRDRDPRRGVVVAVAWPAAGSPRSTGSRWCRRRRPTSG